MEERRTVGSEDTPFGIKGNVVFSDDDSHPDLRIAHRKSKEFCKSVLESALEWDLVEGRVVSIYGIGGEGKSYFVHEVYDDAAAVAAAYEDRRVPADRAKVRRVYIDFYSEGADRLSRLRKVFDAFMAQGVFCHSFCIAYHSFLHPKAENLIAAGYLEDLETCSDGKADDLFTFATDSTLGLVSTALDVAASAFNPIGPLRELVGIAWEARGRREKARAESDARSLLHAYANYEGRSLLSRMPDLLLTDLTDYVRAHPGERLLVIVDSFEHLCSKDLTNTLGETGRLIRRLTHVPSTLWVIAGRLALRGDGWDNVVCYPIELVGLNAEETKQILARKGIESPLAVRRVQEITGGIPVFVGLCADYLNRRGADTPIEFERLLSDGVTRDELLDHYLDGMDDRARKSVFVMGYLREWNEDLLWDVLESCVAEDDAGAIVEGVESGSIPFVSRRGDGYQIHEVIGSMLRSIAPSERDMHTFYASLYRCLDVMAKHHQDKRRGMLAGEWHARALVLSRARFDLGMHVEGFLRAYRRILTVEDIRRGRRDYVAELRWVGLYTDARDVIEDVLSAHGNAWDAYGIELRLELAAVLSQLYVQQDDVSHHFRAMAIEEEVLEHLDNEPHPDEGLLMRVRNSLGTSRYRIARSYEDIEVSLSFHGLNYEKVCEKSDEEMASFDTTILNNYGISCLAAAGLCSNDTARVLWLEAAGKAFDAAVKARESILGARDNRTLMSMTNRGISLYRLAELKRSDGLFAEAEACLDSVQRRLDDWEYPAGSDRRLYNSYHRALLDEARARVSEESGDEASAVVLMREALLQLKNVRDARERYGADERDCRKSRDAVVRCEQWLLDHGVIAE